MEAPLLGARATFLKTTEQTNGELLRVEVVLPPGFSVSEHVHPIQEERHHVVRGILRARVGGKSGTTVSASWQSVLAGCRTLGVTLATAKICAWFPSTGLRCTRKRC